MLELLIRLGQRITLKSEGQWTPVRLRCLKQQLYAGADTRSVAGWKARMFPWCKPSANAPI